MKTEEEINPAALSAALRGDARNALLASMPGGIEAQEAQGQRELCASGQRLPKDIRACGRPIANDVLLEKLGIRIGAEADDIFNYAELPEGWKVVPTDHSMWNKLVDAKGRERGGIFYKAAFYDRHAHMAIDNRYTVKNEYQDVADHSNHNKRIVVFDHATPQPVFTGEWTADYMDSAGNESAKAWLQKNFPNHEDPFAYWD